MVIRNTSKLTTVSEIVEYVRKRLEDTKSDNITVYLPHLNKIDLKQLQKCFASVKPSAFGYVEFRI
ncbi:hypothetical protein ES708_32256 [subsurface metagenome]